MKTYISLFSSAGIGCYGFKQAGFECVSTNEIIERRLEIQKANNKCKFETGYISGSISEKSTQLKIIKEYDKFVEKYHITDLDVLIATPPCQGMSLANHKKNGEDMARNSLVIESLNQIHYFKPKFFVLENVMRFLKTICTDNDKKNKLISEAIYYNLGKYYNIESKVMNFKNYGANSSRTRTIVLGVRKDLGDIDVTKFFPIEQKEKTLKEVIGKLDSLKNMGDISENDIFHNFRNYDKRMISWISNTSYGQSAFDNGISTHRPHRVVNGEVVQNKNKNGDKYKRQTWDKVAPCVHTRNDILASQNTVHPEENRVFSVRELMLMMNIPKSFRWTKDSLSKLNKLSVEEKKEYIKRNDVNIRQCIGEAVPPVIFNQIAKRIGDFLESKID